VCIPTFGPYADVGLFRELVAAAEDLGYAEAWFSDHVVMPGYAAAIGTEWLEPIACCLTGLASTKRLRFGTDILVAPYRNPVLLAKMAATADVLSGGRLTLAMGVGYIRGEFAALNAPPYEERGAVTDEYITVLRCLFGSRGPVSFRGRYVVFDDIHFAPVPVQNPLPIWVGGNVPAARRRAAMLGDGWHPLFPGVEEYAAGVEEISASGTLREGFTFSYSCAQVEIVEGPRAPSATYEHYGDLPAEFSYAPPFPTRPDGTTRFVGDPSLVTQDIREYCDAGVSHFTLRFWTGGPDQTPEWLIGQMRRFSEQVLPSSPGGALRT
jgi:probable F420-dependent oxidoreductase